MSLLALLFIIGAILLAAEVVVPGGILGILAALMLLGGVVLAFIDHGSTGGWLAIVGALGLVAITLWLEFVVLPRTPLGKKLFLKAEIQGASQPPLAARESVVGQLGVADTVLSPTGYVVVGGKRYEAYSRSGLVAKSNTLLVVELDNFRLIVQKN